MSTFESNVRAKELQSILKNSDGEKSMPRNRREISKFRRYFPQVNNENIAKKRRGNPILLFTLISGTGHADQKSNSFHQWNCGWNCTTANTISAWYSYHMEARRNHPSNRCRSIMAEWVHPNWNSLSKVIKLRLIHVASIQYTGMLCGGFLSGFLSDAFGRRTAMMLVMVPIIAISFMISTAQSFWVVCLAYFLLDFMMGLKNAASAIYVSEIR